MKIKPEPIIFIREKETKNTIRFKEQPGIGQPPIIGTIYVQKWSYPAEAKQLKVTVEVI